MTQYTELSDKELYEMITDWANRTDETATTVKKELHTEWMSRQK